MLNEDGEHDQLATKPLGVLIRERGSIAAALHPSFVCFEVAYVEELWMSIAIYMTVLDEMSDP